MQIEFKCEFLSAPLYFKILAPYNPDRKLESLNYSLPRVKNKHHKSLVPAASVAIFLGSWQKLLLRRWPIIYFVTSIAFVTGNI